MTHSKAWRQFRAVMIAADSLCIICTYLLADLLRCHLLRRTAWPEIFPDGTSSVRVHMSVLALLPFIWPAILHASGWYQQKWRSLTWLLRSAAVSTGVIALTMAALALLVQRELFPRAQIALVAAFLPATTLGVRGITNVLGRWLGQRRRHHVLIVGTSRDSIRMRRLFRTAALGQPRVIGHLRGHWELDEPEIAACEILGSVDRLGPILDSEVVDEVIFSTPLEHLAEAMPYVRLCEEVGVTAQIQAESMICHSIPEILNFHGLPLLAYTPTRHSPELLTLKRAADLFIAGVGIVLAGPIMLICAMIIKLLSPGPVLFRQQRSGLNGREFQMFKFRTMEPGAEMQQAEIAHLNESTGPVFKISNDPRVTSVGRALRRWSLDELPQLFNVIKGDMSIVGPRPPIPGEVAQYDRWQRRRLSMRPGLTCIWQIKGRHRIGFEEWMQLDLFYIDHWSLRLDFLILCRTVCTVLGASGA